MLRPLPPRSAPELESDFDSDFDSDDESTEMRGLADVLEPVATLAPVSMPVSMRTMRSAHAPSVAPIPVQDFAFADTVFARELPDESSPPSGPILVHEPGGGTQCMTPLAFPVPDPAAEADLATRCRLVLSRARSAVRAAIEELREQWDATAEMALEVEPRPPSHFAFFLGRVRALWTSWQWDRADLVRAAMIGTAVFVVAAAAGAATLGEPSAASADTEVRAPRTLEQHTGRVANVRARAPSR